LLRSAALLCGRLAQPPRGRRAPDSWPRHTRAL